MPQRRVASVRNAVGRMGSKGPKVGVEESVF